MTNPKSSNRQAIRLTQAEQHLLGAWLQAPCKATFVSTLPLPDAVRVVDVVKMLFNAGVDLLPPEPPAPSERALAQRKRRQERQTAAPSAPVEPQQARSI